MKIPFISQHLTKSHYYLHPRRSYKSWHHTESRLNSWFNLVYLQCSSLAPLLLLFIILLLLPQQVSDSSPQRLEASISSPVRPINNVMNHWAELLTGSGRKTGMHLRHVLVSEESSQTFLEPRIPGVNCKWYSDTLSSPDRQNNRTHHFVLEYLGSLSSSS